MIANLTFCLEWLALNLIGNLFIPFACLFLCVIFYRAQTSAAESHLRLLKSHLPPNEVVQLFEAFCMLADVCYNPPHTGIAAVVEVHDWKFHLIAAADGGEIWLWSVIASESTLKEAFGTIPEFIVVIRGSLSLFDWISTDRTLIHAVGSSNIDKYADAVEKYKKKVDSLLQRTVHNGSSIMLCGHSLGASMAEALHVLYSRHRNFKSVGAVTFDSPGQPAEYRKAHGFTDQAISRIWTLNNRPNIVNTTTAPCAKDFFYSCGLGRHIFLSDLAALGTTIFHERSIRSILSFAVEHVVLSHKLSDILKHIQSGCILREDACSWPVYSGSALRLLHSLVTKTVKPLPHHANPLPSNDHVALENNYPQNLNDFVMSTPYKVPFKLLKTLIAQCQESDIIIPFVGCTGQGKTTTFGRLINSDLDVRLTGHVLASHVGNGVNNSTSPILVYWKDKSLENDKKAKVYLLDIPGFGGNLADSHFDEIVGEIVSLSKSNESPYEKAPIDKQLVMVLNHLGFVFPQVIIVVKNVIDEATKEYYAKLGEVNEETRFTVAYNADLSIEVDSECVKQRRDNYNEIFAHIANVQHMTYCAAKPHTTSEFRGYTIANMESYLLGLDMPFSPYDNGIVIVPDNSNTEEESIKEQRSPRTWGRFCLDFVPVVGPAYNCYENIKDRKYTWAALDVAFIGADVLTLGWTSLAKTRVIKEIFTVTQVSRNVWTPLGRGAYNYVGKEGVNVLRRTGLGVAEGIGKLVVRSAVPTERKKKSAKKSAASEKK